jgi:Poly (ADP-ribose) glycohydrolase (PARG)
MKRAEPTYQHVIWPWKTKNWPKIKSALTEPINNFIDLDAKIASLRESKTRPRLLHELFDLYYSNDDYQNVRIESVVLFGKILPTLQKLILDGPRAFKNFSGRLLLPGQSTNITITRRQAAIITACMWFGLFEYDYIAPGHSAPGHSAPGHSASGHSPHVHTPLTIDEFSEPTFMYGIEAGNVSVLQFMLAYFERLGTLLDTADFENGILIIQRAVLKPHNWADDSRQVITPTIGEGRSDDTFAPVQIAYAHQFIGGDLFKSSITQEELTLLIRPECLSMLIFCARLDRNESVCIYGAEKFSQYSGIGSSIRYLEKYGDTTSRGHSGGTIMLKNCIVFIDATQKSAARDQAMGEFDRDLNKAFCGMGMYHGAGGVACGNWSYGFNGSNMQVKFIQLLLAASAVGRSLEYHPIGRDFEKQLLPFIDWVVREKITIGELYGTYKDLVSSLSGTARFGDLNIFESLMDTV